MLEMCTHPLVPSGCGYAPHGTFVGWQTRQLWQGSLRLCSQVSAAPDSRRSACSSRCAAGWLVAPWNDV